MRRLCAAAELLSGLLAAWFILCFFAIALLSIAYPYPLEWMEGQTIDVIARVATGKPIYVAPTIEYVPFIYPPLYYYVAAGLSQLTGISFLTGRLVSLAAIAALGWLLYAWIRKEGAARRTALLGVGLFFSTYELSARWFDVARIDSLYVLFVFAGLYVFMHAKRARGAALAGALFIAAFFTKQNTFIIIAPLLLAGLFLERRQALLAGGIFLLGTLVLFYLGNKASGGWMHYYLIDLPSSHRIDAKYYLGFWLDDLGAHLAPGILLCALGWWDMFRADRRRGLKYLALAAGMVGASYAGRLHRYGWTNVLIPTHLVIALCAALALSWWINAGMRRKYLLGVALVVLQLGMLLYNPANDIPGAEARAEGDWFVKKVAELDGEVFMPEIQFVPTYAKKQSFSYGVAAVDVYQASPKEHPEAAGNLREEMADAIRNQRFGAIVTSRLIGLPGLSEYYAPYKTVAFPRKFVSGYVSDRPMMIMLPIDKGGTIHKKLPQPDGSMP